MTFPKMELKKPLNETTALEAFEVLQGAAVALARGQDLPEDVKRWLGVGILRMCSGTNLNESFGVKKKKKSDSQMHAVRYALVERLRKDGVKKDEAMEQVATKMKATFEGVVESWKIQNKIQKDFDKRVEEFRRGNSLPLSPPSEKH